MERKDWTLLAIASAGGEPIQPVQLQKALFLLGRERAVHVPGFYEFEKHNWGPFSKAIFEDAEKLEAEGLVVIVRLPWRSMKEYLPTEAGKRMAESFMKEVPGDSGSYLMRAVQWVRSLSFSELLTQIYKRYPEFRTNSLFREPA